MLERKLYKTKLCILYQRGRCSRQSCSFAHGDVELRRFHPSLNGRREYRGADLRDKLERRNSPHRRYTPGRDSRGRRAFHNKQISHDRGFSPSGSPVRRSERRQEKSQKLDGQSDVSTSPRTSDGHENRFREGKPSSYDERISVEEKLKEAQMDIESYDEHKCELEIALKERDEEADKLSTKIEELESQLKNERDDCRRLISKNKKFIKALGRYLRAQEELKRSQSRLQRLADQLDSVNLKPGGNEEDSSVNILSDGEPNQFSNRYELQNHASPHKKRSRLSMGTSEETKPGSSQIPMKTEKLTMQSENCRKETGAVNSMLARNDVHKLHADDYKQKIGRTSFSGTASDKGKASDMGSSLPATSMAAHAVDEFIEAIEMEEKSGALGATTTFQNGSVEVKVGLPYPLPPPPKIAPNAYDQYEGDDEVVDVEEVDTETGDADVNSEVEIEKE